VDTEAGRPYKVYKCPGGFRVEDPFGKTRGRRKRLSSAKDLADRLSLGLKTYGEARHVLTLWPQLHIRKSMTFKNPYVIRTSDGIAVKRFLRRFQAQWWLDRYDNRRQARASQLTSPDKKPRPLDGVIERWLISDRGLCYPERVAEIIDLLKAGAA
jgi:hypothetical protein